MLGPGCGRSRQPHLPVHQRPGPHPADSTATLRGLAIRRSLGPLDDPGLVSFPGPGLPGRLQALGRRPGHPGTVLEPGSIRTSRPGFPPLALRTVTSDQLRRQDDGPRAPCTTDEDASVTAIRKTLSAASGRRSLLPSSCWLSERVQVGTIGSVSRDSNSAMALLYFQASASARLQRGPQGIQRAVHPSRVAYQLRLSAHLRVRGWPSLPAPLGQVRQPAQRDAHPVPAANRGASEVTCACVAGRHCQLSLGRRHRRAGAAISNCMRTTTRS
jgi:hypothetical protein